MIAILPSNRPAVVLPRTMVEHADITDDSYFLKFLPRNLSYAEEGYLDEYSISSQFIRVPKAEKILLYKAKLKRTSEIMETAWQLDTSDIDSIDRPKVRDDSEGDTEEISKTDEKFYLCSDSGSEEGVFVNMMDDLDSVDSHNDGGGSMESEAYFSADSINSPEENDCGIAPNEINLSEKVSSELRKVSSDGCLEEKPNSDKDLDKNLSTSEGNLSKERKFAKLKVELKSGTITGDEAHQYLLEVPESPVYDEPEFNINKAELRKSSSLKCNKTPPGTPRRKKMVRFADVMGLDLESVRHVMNQEQPPRIPASAMADLKVGVEQERKDMGSRYLDICFPQPGALENFMQKVMANKVCLENCIITDLSITGVVRVANIGYHKVVRIRYTINNWITFYDVMASYIQRSCDVTSDRFSFTIVAPAAVGPGSRIEFCISFTVNDTVYWDNNDNQNYVILCYAKTTPTETEESWMHFV